MKVAEAVAPFNTEGAPVHIHQHLPAPPVVTSDQLATIVGCVRKTVHKRLDVARVPFTTIGKVRVYAWADVLAVVRELGTKPPPPPAPRRPTPKVVAKPGMTALDRARANGLVVVEKDGER